MDPEVVSKFLDEQREAAPDHLQQSFLTIEDYWDRKLWHQLTDVLVDYFNTPASAAQRLPLFRHFILSFAEKINQLKFVSLALLTATQCSDDHERLSFLTDLTAKVNKPSSQDAYVYALVATSEIKLRLEDYAGTRKDLDTAESILDSFDSVETEVHAAFYRTNAAYYQANSDFGAYYKNALLYLACIDLKTLSLEDAQSRAHDLSVAALISTSIYNFGELLLHPILDSLTSTPHAWLRDLLFTYNRGDLAGYQRLEHQISVSPLLSSHQDFLAQKIALSALTEAVFRRPPHDRAMTFSTIAQETNVQPKDIEILIMKALSLGLLKGSIDQVAGIARINWVQPKVLDMKQIDSMRGRLRDWDSSVNQLGNWIEGVGKDVWAA
ncbi:MAG: hypothetical protein Q9195_000380 [Heterodermia aff. obscurata]